jgi:DNA-binding transcriptional LysR family regulator
MNESIDLSTLRVVVSAADFGSISAAGDHLRLSVAAASARISLLEEALGFRIFDRSPRGVHPTPAGHMLLKRSRELLSDADRLANDLQDYSRGLKGQVRVLANASALVEVLPSLIEQFTRDFPMVHVDLEERGSPDIPLALAEGRADIGIVDLPLAPPGLQFFDFFSDTLVLLVCANHRLAGESAVALRDALDEPFIGLANSTALSHRLQASAAAEGMALKVRMRMRSFDAQTRMIAAGLGVGVLPLEAVAPQLRQLPLKAVRLTDAWSRRTHSLAVRSDAPPAPAVQTLMQALLAQHGG